MSIDFHTAGTQTITATDTVTSSSSPVTITAGSFDQFGFIGLANTAAGAWEFFTVEAEDAYGNEVSSYSGTVDFSSSDPQIQYLPASESFSGPSTLITIEFETAGTQTITAADSGASVTSSSSPVTITAGSFDKFGFIGLQSGAAGPQTFTVEAEDAYGNEVSSFGGLVSLSSSDPQATGLPSGFTNFSSPAETFSIAFKTAGTQTITADDLSATVVSFSSPVTITAGAFDKFGFIGLSGGAAGIVQSVTVEAEDTYGNLVSSFSDVVNFSSSDPQIQFLTPTYTFSGPSTTLTIDLETAGTQTITAADSGASVTSSSSPVTITAGPFDKFGFIGLENGAAGTTQTFTVEAEDTYGNEVSSFSGSVALVSSDTQATGLPSGLNSFSSPAETFSIAFKTAGTQSITAGNLFPPPLVTSSSSPVTITAGAFDKFGFIGLESGTAGTPQTITVEAEDAYGNEVSSFDGTESIYSSDPSSTGLPGLTSFSSVQETFTVTFKTAGTQSITAVDISETLSTSSSPVTITAGSFDKFGFIGLSDSTAGVAQSVTVEAEDAYGNEVPSFSGDVTITSSDPQASGLPGLFTFGSGQDELTINFETAGEQSITAIDPPATVTSSSSPVSISAGSFDEFTFIGLDNVAAGTPQSFTVQADDAYGNEVSSFSGAVDLSSTDPHATGLPSTSTFSSPSQVVTIAFETAGTQTLSAATSTISSSSSPVTITAGALDQFGFIGLAGGTAGAPDTVTIAAEDVFGNVVTSFVGNVSFSSTDPQAVLPAEFTFQNDDDGVHIFNDGVTLETAGSQTVTVTSTGTPAYSGTAAANIIPAGAATFSLTPSVAPGLAETVNITAHDAYGNVATGYGGTLDFATSDPDAVLPATDTMTAGEGSFLFTFSSTGTFSISASDSVDSDIHGSTPVTIYQQTTEPGNVSSPQVQVFYGQHVTLTATFTATAVGDVPLTGSVAFYDGTTYLGTATIVPGDPPATVNGQATITVPLLTPGSYTITAIYSGNGDYASASSAAPLTVNVAPATTSTTLTTATTPQGTNLIAQVVATSPGSPPIGGTVSFYDNGTLLGTAPVTNGFASLAIGDLPPGSHTVSSKLLR